MSGARARRRAAAACGLAAAIGGGLGIIAAGCGGDGDALVGGDCASGYAPCGNNCCPVGSSDGAADGTLADGADGADGSRSFDGALADRFGPGADGAKDGPSDTGHGDAGDGAGGGGDAGDGGGGVDSGEDAPESGLLCTPPLIDCGGMCVDTTSDPLNCGGCGIVCPSQICTSSHCVGSTAGGIVFIGHDYLTTPPGVAQARVLTNAAFIPESNPLAIMSFEEYANATAVQRVKTILSSAASQVGRQLSVTSTSNESDVPSKLVYPAYQVLIVHDQSGATPDAGTLASLGASWASTLSSFAQAGGVVIVLDGGTGTAQMPAFTTATGLLSVTAQSPVTATFLDDVAPGDVVGVNVVSPYYAGVNSVSVATEPNGGNVAYVIEQANDAGPGAPVVVHKVF